MLRQSGLEAWKYYSVSLRFSPADDKNYRFHDSKWYSVGKYDSNQLIHSACTLPYFCKKKFARRQVVLKLVILLCIELGEQLVDSGVSGVLFNLV